MHVYISLKKVLLFLAALVVAAEIIVMLWLTKLINASLYRMFGTTDKPIVSPVMYSSLIVIVIFTILITYIAYQFLTYKENMEKDRDFKDTIELLKSKEQN